MSTFNRFLYGTNAVLQKTQTENPNENIISAIFCSMRQKESSSPPKWIPLWGRVFQHTGTFIVTDSKFVLSTQFFSPALLLAIGLPVLGIFLFIGTGDFTWLIPTLPGLIILQQIRPFRQYIPRSSIEDVKVYTQEGYLNNISRFVVLSKGKYFDIYTSDSIPDTIIKDIRSSASHKRGKEEPDMAV